MTSRPLFISVAESIVILPPIAQVGCASASLDGDVRELGARAAAERAAARRSGRACRPCPARSPASSWCSAECSESTGMICAPVASASAMTSSPPTTSDSLLASARSIPSPSVGDRRPEPGRADERVEHEVGAGLERRAARAPRRPASTSPSVHASAARAAASASASAIRVDAEARAPARRAPPTSARRDRPTSSSSSRALDDVERLRADRAGRAEDEEAAGHGTPD